MATTAPTVTVDLAQAKRTLAQIEQEMTTMYLEREEAVRLALVCQLSGQHGVYIGPPGTGKTTMLEELASRFCDPLGSGLTFFSTLLTRFTTVEELCGLPSFSGMKNDTLTRVITDMLPEAEIAFLDEIWKASSAILNIILKLIDQRKFKNGTVWMDCPLISLFGASNELPEGNDLAAIRDRILFTYFVGYLSQPNFKLLMQRKAGLEPDPFTAPKTTMPRDVFFALRAHAASLPFSPDVIEKIDAIREDCFKQGIQVSDRRNGQGLLTMQANAVIEERNQVSEDDLPILTHAFWYELGQRKTVAGIVSKHSNPALARALEIKDEADSTFTQAMAQIEQLTATNQRGQRSQVASEASGKLQVALEELEPLLKQHKTNKRIAAAYESVHKQNITLLKTMGFKLNL